MTVWKSRCGRMELRLGDYREVLEDVECDALLSDPPYSARTHKGHNEGTKTANAKAEKWVRPSDGVAVEVRRRRDLGYKPWATEDVAEFSTFFDTRTRGWTVVFSDHDLARTWAASLAELGRYVFAPLPFVAPGSRVRMTGDGPACWACWITVARPRCQPYSKWGALPGSYVGKSDRGTHGGNSSVVVGAKPLWLMQALVRDYSRPDDLVCDPCAGGGTTLLAAAIEGRRAIGAEVDPATFELAAKRLEAGYTPVLAGMRT